MQSTNSSIEAHGHRGCRGLFPENSIPAFLEACRLEVDYLELDVVASEDGEIIVSHDPYFSHLFTSDENGKAVNKSQGEALNIAKLSLTTIQSFDVGTKTNYKYPEQQSIACYKPTLDQVVRAVEQYCSNKNIKTPRFNIEIKFNSEHQDYFPKREAYAKLFLNKIAHLGIANQSIIQCFDPPLLNNMHRLNPNLKYGLLVENLNTPESNLGFLDFKPYGYMPYFELVDRPTLEYCKKHTLHLIVWTVNTEEDILKMKEIGVNGIISDYPNRLANLL